MIEDFGRWFIIVILGYGVLMVPRSIIKDIEGRKPETVSEAVITRMIGCFITLYMIYLLWPR